DALAGLRRGPPPADAGALGAAGDYVGAVLRLAARLADGLAHAHERGVLHRDIKPANVLLADDGQPMLLDFNLAAEAATPAGAAVVAKCLDPAPARRYQTARQLHDDLQRHLADEPLKFAREPSLRERVRKWRRRHPRVAVALVAAVLALPLAAAYVARGRDLA